MSKLYVCMNDTFMSGWGPADKKTNVLQIACDTMEQGIAVQKAAEDRPEMKRIRLNTKPCRDNANRYVSEKHFTELSGPWLKYWLSEYQIFKAAEYRLSQQGIKIEWHNGQRFAYLALDCAMSNTFEDLPVDGIFNIDPRDDGSQLAQTVLNWIETTKKEGK